ncbi:MAG: hypothetical protein KY476_21070 [Planctomycetes bacterium]|nr:hypothetical protein [Planctomycetota bacterium]
MLESSAIRVPQFVVTAEGEFFGEDTGHNREVVRRIHACVNACASLTTEELERGIVEDMRRVIADVVPLLQSRRSGGTVDSSLPQAQSDTAASG